MQSNEFKGIAFLYTSATLAYSLLFRILSFPVPELQAEIGLYPDFFPRGSAVISYSKGIDSIELVDWITDEENFEDTIFKYAILIGCAARTLPEEQGMLEMVMENVIFIISLEDCRLLYQMSLEGVTDRILLQYLNRYTVIEDTRQPVSTCYSLRRCPYSPSVLPVD